MRKMYQMLAFLLLLGSLPAAAFAQDMASVIGRAQNTMKYIERTDRVIERTIFDFIYKANNSSYFFQYELYDLETYHLNIIGDGTRATTGNVKILQFAKGTWTQVAEYNSGGVDFNITFNPKQRDTYKIIFTCTLRNENERAGVALLIDREK